MTKLRPAQDDRDRRRRDLIPAMADWLWEADAAGCVSFLSPEFAASTGLSPQSLLGKRLAQLDAADLAGTPAAEDGGFEGHWGTGKTVSAEIEANRALERYRQLFEVAADWFWETDA